LNNCNLVPQADPNTSSSGQRLMKVMALMQLSQAAPTLYDPIKIHTAALSAIGWPDPEEFFVPPAARGQPPPQLVQAQAEMANKAKDSDARVEEAKARTTEAQAKAAESQAKVQGVGHFAPKQPEATGIGAAVPEPETTLDMAKAHATMMDAVTRAREATIHEHEAAVENTNRDQDRQADLQQAAIALAGDVVKAPTAGESGKQVSVTGAGQKARKIIRDVDKGVAPHQKSE